MIELVLSSLIGPNFPKTKKEVSKFAPQRSMRYSNFILLIFPNNLRDWSCQNLLVSWLIVLIFKKLVFNFFYI